MDDRPRPTDNQNLDARGVPHPHGMLGSVARTGWEDVFLEAFRNSGIIRTALSAAGITYPLLHRRVKSDPEFAQQYEYARRDAVAILERAAWKRAVSGVERRRTIFYKGKAVGEEVVTEYSDGLLKFLLTANDPDKYREQVDHNYKLSILRAEAQRIAEAEGLPVDEVVAEAERIVYGKG